MTQKPLLIVPAASGYIVVALDKAPDLAIDEAQCFESVGGRYSCGGVIDAVRAHFERKTSGADESAPVTTLQVVA